MENSFLPRRALDIGCTSYGITAIFFHSSFTLRSGCPPTLWIFLSVRSSDCRHEWPGILSRASARRPTTVPRPTPWRWVPHWETAAGHRSFGRLIFSFRLPPERFFRLAPMYWWRFLKNLLTSPKEKIIWLNTRKLDCLQKINFPLHLYMGIYKASYNRTSKNSSLFKPKIQPCYAHTKQKKTYTSTHNETRGAVCIPASSYCACMYRSLIFLCVCFIPQPRGCYILTQSFIFVQSEWKNCFFFVYCGADFNPWKSQRYREFRWRLALTLIIKCDILFLLKGIIF